MFKKSGYGKSNKFQKKFENTSISALWKTKRPNLYTGTLRELDGLVELIKKARAAGEGITFWLWKNDPSKGFPGVFNLQASVSKPNPNTIQKDEEDEEDNGEEQEVETDEEEEDDL